MVNVEQELEELESKLKLPDKFKESILHAVNYILSNYYKDVDKIVLFGSCSRNSPKITSDIDIMIMSKDILDRETELDIRYELLDHPKYVSCDVIFYTYNSFRSTRTLFTNQIRKDGKILWKKEEIPTTV